MNDDAAEIADRFALGGAPRLSGPAARGHQGEVWKLDTDSGSWAVKRSFGPVDEADLTEGAAFQERARLAGVPTPRSVRSVGGTLLARVRFGTVRVDEWVDMAEPDNGVDPATIGRTVAALHNVHSEPTAEFDPWYHQGVGAARWDELVGQLTSAGAPFASELTDQRDELIAMEALVEAPIVLQWCHRDLWADNVRRGTDGRLWVIDWQDSGAADPSGELAALLFDYAYDDRDRAFAMYHAYRAAKGPGRVNRPQHFSMAIAQLGHILEISCTRWLAAVDQADRVLNEGRVAEFVTRPLSRGLIDRILDALDD
ncbi:MAG: aminoglycoside phosphotransferase [Ilumatobacteraceae bacterium]|nr:aminoglycoside phosphotransferase [Ilumatobacteraceae bacterium]